MMDPAFRNRLSRAPLALAAVLACALPAAAQFNASVSGTIEDRTGAIIPGATVILTNLSTQQVLSSTTTGDGFYRFNQLAPAHYRITVNATGFKNTTLDNLIVEAEKPNNFDVKLDTGGSTETVTVNADEAQTLQTGDADVNRTLTGEEIQRLPIFGSDPFELLRTAPGITGDGARSGTGNSVFLPNGAGPGASNSGIFQTENQIQISADGQRVADNNYTIDGVSVNSLGRGGSAVVTPNQESIQSITVISTSYNAADGRNTGAQIKTITNSGTNNVHGSLYFLYDDPGLNAFNRYGGPNNAAPVRNNNKARNYAASLGGPIIKDKLFAFGSYQGFTAFNNSTFTTYIDTAQYRASVIANRPNGLTAGQFLSPGNQPQVVSVLTQTCAGYANNQGTYIPKQVNDIGPVVTQTNTAGPYCQVVAGGLDIGSVTAGGASQEGVYLTNNSASGTTAAPGLRTRVGGGFVGGGLDGIPDVQNVEVNSPLRTRGNQFNGRIDYHATQKDLIAGSTFFTKLDNSSLSGRTARPNSAVPFKPLNSAVTFIYIHTFSPRWLNEFRANGTRFTDNGTRDFAGTVNLGLPYIDVETVPFTSVDYGVVRNNTTGAGLAQNTLEYTDQVTHVVGNHSIKFGGGIRFEQDNNDLSGNDRPFYAFGGYWNLANDAPFFEAATVNPNTGGTANTGRQYRSQTIYGFIQHDWKVTPALQFNAGFRYEIYTPYHNKSFRTFEPVLGQGANALSGLTLQSTDALYNTDYGHFAPKFAFDFSPAAFQGKAVLRGGFGIAYNHLDVSLFENSLEDGPGIASFGIFGAGTAADGFTPNNINIIRYAHGTSTSPQSYPINPAFATGTNANGFPNGLNGAPAPQVELYGLVGKIKNPMSYLYSLEAETQLPGKVTLTTGYAGSVGHHYARLVNQNFLYSQANSPTFQFLAAQTDSNQAYNALNVRVKKNIFHGLQFDGTYTWSKDIDEISSGDFADGLANQTNPANNKSERGPSDFDTRNRFVGTVLYTTPKIRTRNRILTEAISGYQATSIVTLHSGFNWTPVVFTNGVQAIAGAATVNPTRPIAYAAGAVPSQIGRSCSNSAFITGSNFANRGPAGTAGGINYFSTANPPALGAYTPIVGRNSQTGPCYRDVDFSVGKQVQFSQLDHLATLRFQANLFNAFNLLQLNPIQTQSSANNIQDQNFGRAGGADSGRVIEFLIRLNF